MSRPYSAADARPKTAAIDSTMLNPEASPIATAAAPDRHGDGERTGRKRHAALRSSTSGDSMNIDSNR